MRGKCIQTPLVLFALSIFPLPLVKAGTWAWAKNVFLDIAPLLQGFGPDGADVLDMALSNFDDAFRDGWKECIENSQPGAGLISMDGLKWLVYRWDDKGLTSVPLPYQYPNAAGDGFVQQVKWSVSNLTVTDNPWVDAVALRDGCSSYVFESRDFVSYLHAAGESVNNDLFGSVESVKAVPTEEYDPEELFEWETTHFSGKLDLELLPLISGYGPTTGANSVIDTLNGPEFYPEVAEAWRAGIEQAVEDSKVYSIMHYYVGERSFLYGSVYANTAGPGTVNITVGTGENSSDLVVTGPGTDTDESNQGNLVDQVITDYSSVITTYTYDFWAQWWKPTSFDGNVDGIDTDQMAVEAVNTNTDLFLSALKDEDAEGYFDSVTQVLAADSPQEEPPTDRCSLEVQVGCKLSRTETTVDCNDIPTPTNPADCTVYVNYTYYVHRGPVGSTLVSATRTRDPPDAHFNNPRMYMESFYGKAPYTFTLDTWEESVVNLCEAEIHTTTLEVITSPIEGDDCIVTDEYVMVVDPPPTPSPTCPNLELQVTCALWDDENTACGAIPPPSNCAASPSQNVQVRYTYTVHNVGSTTADIIKLSRFPPGNVGHAEDYDLPFSGDLMPLYKVTLEEMAYANKCSARTYNTAFEATSKFNAEGAAVCSDEASHVWSTPGGMSRMRPMVSGSVGKEDQEGESRNIPNIQVMISSDGTSASARTGVSWLVACLFVTIWGAGMISAGW